jgi:hypothetical protein
MFILFAGLVSAEQKDIHNSWHEASDTFVLEGRVFSLTLGSNNELLKVNIDNDSIMFVKLGKCAEYDIYTVCFLEKSIEVDTATFIGASAIPGIKIKVLKELGPNLIATQVVPKLNILEKNKITITLKNEAETIVDSFNYELIIPEGITIVDKGDFILDGNKLSVSGVRMNKGDEKTFKFNIMVVNGGNKQAKYSIQMTGEGVNRNKTGSINMNSPLPYAIAVTLSPVKPNILDESKLLITIKNTGVSDLKVEDLKIIGSSQLFYLSQSELSQTGIGKYALKNEDIIKPSESKDYYLEFSSSFTGAFNFTGTITLVYEGKIFNYNLSKSNIYSANGMAPSLLTSKSDVLTGEDVEVVYYLVNDADGMSFYNLSADITSGFFNEHIELDKLSPGNSKDVFRKRYVVPVVEKDTIYSINATLEYFTVTKEKKKLVSTKNIKVTSNGTLITIDQKTSVLEVYAGSEFIVEVNIKNMKEEGFDFEVKDSVSDGVIFIGGMDLRNYSLRGKQSDLAYAYKIFVPLNYTQNIINLSSTIRIPIYNYIKTDVSSIKVKFNSSINNSGGVVGKTSGESNKTSLNNEVEGIDVKSSNSDVEASGLKRFFKSVDTFFSNLFG